MASLIVTSLVAAGLLVGNTPDIAPDPVPLGDRAVVTQVQQGYIEEDGLGLEEDLAQDGYGRRPRQRVMPVQAGDIGCSRAARQAVEMTGGEVLSVVPARSGKPICKVTVLVIKANGRPKRIKLRIPMDY